MDLLIWLKIARESVCLVIVPSHLIIVYGLGVINLICLRVLLTP